MCCNNSFGNTNIKELKNLNTHWTPTQHLLSNIVSTAAILDSGASNHYLKTSVPLNKSKLTTVGPIVTLPNGETMTASHQSSLELQQLCHAGNRAYLFPSLQSANLLSIGQLCDDGC